MRRNDLSGSGQTRRPIAALLALTVAGLVTTAQPSAAQTGPQLKSTEITLPAYPAYIVTGKSQLHYFGEKKPGVVANDYGFAQDADTTLLGFSTPFKKTKGLAAPVYLTADHQTFDAFNRTADGWGNARRGAVSLAGISRQTPNSPWRLVYFSPQTQGFLPAFAAPLTGNPRGVAILSHASGEKSRILVATTTGLSLKKPPFLGEAQSNLESVASGIRNGGRILDLFKTPSWGIGHVSEPFVKDENGNLFGGMAGNSVDNGRVLLAYVENDDKTIHVADLQYNFETGKFTNSREIQIAASSPVYRAAVRYRPNSKTIVTMWIDAPSARTAHLAIDNPDNQERYADYCETDVSYVANEYEPLRFDYKAVATRVSTNDGPFQSGFVDFFEEVVACTGIKYQLDTDDAGLKDQIGNGATLNIDTWRKRFSKSGLKREKTVVVLDPSDSHFRVPDTHIEFPCFWLRHHRDLRKPEEEHCSALPEGSQGSQGFFRVEDAGTVTVNNFLSRNNGSGVDTVLVATRFPAEPARNSGAQVQSWSMATFSDSSCCPLAVPLPAQVSDVTLEFDNPDRPVLDQGKPLPLAVLAAPPRVANAGQDPPSVPLFAKSASTGSSQGTSVSTRIGALFGVDVDLGLGGLEVETEYEREVGESFTESIERTVTDLFAGVLDDDTIVYQAPQLWRWDGTVKKSALGIGLGERVSVREPKGTVTSSATLSSLRVRYPDLFGPNGGFTTSMKRLLPHSVGDPGSYLPWRDGASVDDYCIGSRAGVFEPIHPRSTVPPNPHYKDPPENPGPDILVSDKKQVLAGTTNSEGARLGIDKSIEQSRVVTDSIDVSVVGKALVFEAGASFGFTWGKEWGRSLGEGVEFEAYVAHIPDDRLANETYNWRMFMCRAAISTPTGVFPVWVLNYTVDDYHGSGGLRPLGSFTAMSPVHSALTDRTPTLRWSQPGTVQSYRWEVEAVAAEDFRTATVTFNTPKDAHEKNQTGTTVTIDKPLLPGQLYRWRVVATDWANLEAASQWEFFRTINVEDPADIRLDIEPPVPQADQEFTVTINVPKDAGATYEWTIDNQKIDSAEAVLRRSFKEPGVHTIAVRVTIDDRSAVQQRTIIVGATANRDDYLMDEDGTLRVRAAGGVLANDEGATGAELVAPPVQGDVTLTTSGGFTYRPPPGFCGRDMFGYAATRGSVPLLGEAWVTIACVNDPPVAAPDVFNLREDERLEVNTPGVLANDRDPDNDPLSLPVGDPPVALHGDLKISPDGRFTYTPRPDFCGLDSFTYRARDRAGLVSSPETVTLRVACVNDPPVAASDGLAGREDEYISLAAPGVLANDRDPDGTTTLIAEQVPGLGEPGFGRAGFGEVKLDPNGAVGYRPRPNFCGVDSFTYRVSDPEGAWSTPTTALVSVACVNDPPVAADDRYAAQGGVELSVGAPGVLGNDVDPDGDRTSAVLVEAPAGGDFQLRADGSFTYTPDVDTHGEQTFTYQVVDPSGEVAETRATIMVQAPTFLTASPLVAQALPGAETKLGRFGARLGLSGGAPAAGEMIRFLAGGVQRCQATTGADGWATCTTKLDTDSLNQYQAEHDPTPEYGASSATSPLVVLGPSGLDTPTFPPAL